MQGGWSIMSHIRVINDVSEQLDVMIDREFPINYASGIRGRILTMDPAPRWWMHLGVAPRPQTRWQRFQMHIGHGLVMRYPLRHVLGFAIRGLFWAKVTSHPSDLDASKAVTL